MSNKNSITYRQVGDYFIPNLIIPPEEVRITLGKWGMMYKSYLEKHKKVLFNSLLMQGKLYQHCFEVENQAKAMYDTLIEQLKEVEGVTEQLKEENQMEWVCRMGNIEARAREIVCAELIYTWCSRGIKTYGCNPLIFKGWTIIIYLIRVTQIVKSSGLLFGRCI